VADNIAITPGSGATVATDDVGGIQYQRVKNCFGADGAATDVSGASPMPVFQQHSGRTFIHLWASGAASGTTGTETAITLTRSGGAGAATSSAATFVPTASKRFRITSLTFGSRGNATATAQVTTFTVRVNSAGAVTTSSNAFLQTRTATPATALAWDRVTLPLEEAGMEIVGDGTLQFGVTANAVFVTNAPTWDVVITGYEYS
jgi:hypothetical protein